MALKTQIKRIETARKKYDSELAKLGRKAIATALGEVIPAGFALVWNQYIPGFNDGDPCTFTVGEVRLMTTKGIVEVDAPATEAREDIPAGEVEVSALADDSEETVPSFALGTEDREFDSDEEDDGVTSLEYGKSSDLKWCGMTSKDFAAVRAAWKLIDDEAILQRAFGADNQIVIHSGGKFEVTDYDCGH